MKKLNIIAILLALALSLTSCSLPEGLIEGILILLTRESSSGEDERAVTEMTDTAMEELQTQGFEIIPEKEASKDTERTVEELLQALKDGEPMKDSSGAEYGKLPQTFSEDSTESTQIQGTTVQFSDEPWETEKTVETFNMEDFTATMTDEERAEWEELTSKTEEDWAKEIAEMEAEFKDFDNSFGDFEPENGTNPEDNGENLEDIEIPDMEEIGKQIEDALNNLPDEYKDLFGEDFDISSLLPWS